MAHVQKRSNKWQARYRDKSGTEHSKRFDRKVDAEGWLATNGADLLRGAWVDPRLGTRAVATSPSGLPSSTNTSSNAISSPTSAPCRWRPSHPL